MQHRMYVVHGRYLQVSFIYQQVIKMLNVRFFQVLHPQFSNLIFYKLLVHIAIIPKGVVFYLPVLQTCEADKRKGELKNRSGIHLRICYNGSG